MGFHIVKRKNMEWWKAWLVRIISILLGIMLSAAVTVFLTGKDPVNVFTTMFDGAFGTERRLWSLLQGIAMLLCISLAVTPAFKMRFWNIGAEGQALMGGLASAACMMFIGDRLPNWLMLIVMAVTSMLAGAIWAVIPAVFKARWNTNETLFTLMMNYIAIGIVAWLQGGPWEGKPGSQIIPTFNKAAVLPKALGVNCGWIIVLLLTVFMFVYMRYTKHGYEVHVLGESENTARYAGMNVPKIIMRTAALSGAICGLVGFLVVSGTDGTLYADVAGGAGFTAITVCWLAQLNPFAMIVIALMLSVLSKGASTLQSAMGIPASITDILTGIILLSMLGCEFFINYKMHFRKSAEKEAA